MVILGLVVFFAGMFGVCLLVDARMRASEAARQAAFLRSGFRS